MGNYDIIYCIRAYTSTSNFHMNINRDLGVNKIDKYITMIKTLYEGVKLSALPMANNEILFRGANISNDEIKKIKSNYGRIFYRSIKRK